MEIPNNKALTTQQFLDLIHGPNAQVYFGVSKKTWKYKPQPFYRAENILRWRNDSGADICFVVNGGGTKNTDINRINSFWIDWDCGKDEQKNYFPLETVIEGKQVFLSQLVKSPVSPSLIVETRNGFHVYWLAQDDVTLEAFDDIQLRLTGFFDSDSSANNRSRLLRLPGFNWVKASSGFGTFPVQVIHSSETRYSFQIMKDSFPQASAAEKIKTMRAFGTHNNSVVNNTTAYCGYQTPTSVVPVSFNTREEAIEYLKTYDLLTFLGYPPDSTGKPVQVLCPVHQETNPSATIYKDPNDEHWVFKCHSSNCGASGTIIDIVCQREKITSTEAIDWLIRHLKITVDNTWQKERVAILDANIVMISDAKALKNNCPDLYRWIGGSIHQLVSKLELAKTHISSPGLQHNSLAVFFASLREMERVARKLQARPDHFGSQARYVDRYAALGLIVKLLDDQIPKEALKTARERQAKHQNDHRQQFYSFPVYDHALLVEANERARKLTAAGATAKSMSRQLIEDVLGPDIAKNVYPQKPTQSNDTARDRFAIEVSGAIEGQIINRGYATAKETVRLMREDDEYKAVTERRVARALPGVFKTLGLVKKTSSSADKDRLGIKSRGYPKIIVAKACSEQLDTVRKKSDRSDDLYATAYETCETAVEPR